MRFEVKDSEVESTKLALADRMAGDLSDDERFLAAALITPLIVGNSSYSADLTTAAGERAAAAVQDVRVHVEQGQVIARQGDPIGDAELEALEALGLNDGAADLATFAGWFLFAALIVGLLLAWLWRFRPGLWHRNSVLVLVSLLVLGATVALKLTAGRSILTYFLPTAAVGMLLTILLDATIATFVMALIALDCRRRERFVARDRGIRVPRRHGRDRDRPARRQGAGVRPGRHRGRARQCDGRVGVLAPRRAGHPRACSSCGWRRPRPGPGRPSRLRARSPCWARCSGSSRCSSCSSWRTRRSRSCGACSSRRPGTYHHSLMVGNLAERAAEAIGADPLLTRVAAYYHDVGKLANPLAFIENQAGGENVHDELDPETQRRRSSSSTSRTASTSPTRRGCRSR